ncbi:unnamed protein product [Rotaria sordida]|uniref:Uncharacterized protein n=1 Tax=Rotaria sordida TaxID=392033 RepID=A0A814BVZ5_9BILA|nr:unnamed protein product [Rotaria sordida]CAF0934793.1 unnamed protein product [Rotaria sordida]CAF3691089.1 unnamed protein product [Rotaria sordida]CAF3922633.1 unnamed protein product [Rotaria sordida]
MMNDVFLPDAMLDRFCSFILPKIHHNIQSLLVELSSMERILLVCDYPKFHKLISNSIKPKAFLKFLADIKFADVEIRTI